MKLLRMSCREAKEESRLEQDGVYTCTCVEARSLSSILAEHALRSWRLSRRSSYFGEHTFADLEATAMLRRHSKPTDKVQHGSSVYRVESLVPSQADHCSCGCICGRQMRQLQRPASKTPTRCLAGLQKGDDICISGAPCHHAEAANRTSMACTLASLYCQKQHHLSLLHNISERSHHGELSDFTNGMQGGRISRLAWQAFRAREHSGD